MNKKHDHDEVLKSGLNLICAKGYNSLGVNEICESTGMTKGAFYNAFGSKENFLLKGMRVYGDATAKRLTAQLAAEGSDRSATERLADLYDYMFDAQPKNNYMGCMVNNIMSELGSASETVGRAATIEFNSFIDAIAPCVQEAQEAGELTNSMDARDLAELLHSTFYGALTRTKSIRDHKPGKHIMQTLINTLKT